MDIDFDLAYVPFQKAFWPFCFIGRTAETGRGSDKQQRDPGPGVKLGSVAARTMPLYMGCPLYLLSEMAPQYVPHPI